MALMWEGFNHVRRSKRACGVSEAYLCYVTLTLPSSSADTSQTNETSNLRRSTIPFLSFTIVQSIIPIFAFEGRLRITSSRI
jgi:hypothetical protein